MTFDWSINLGHVLTLCIYVAAVFAAFFAIKTEVAIMAERLQTLGGRVLNVESNLKELTHIAISIAETKKALENMDDRFNEQSRRMNNIEARINAYHHGPSGA